MPVSAVSHLPALGSQTGSGGEAGPRARSAQGQILDATSMTGHSSAAAHVVENSITPSHSNFTHENKQLQAILYPQLH